MKISICLQADRWKQLLGILNEITHGSKADQRLITDFAVQVEYELNPSRQDHWSEAHCTPEKRISL